MSDFQRFSCATLIAAVTLAGCNATGIPERNLGAGPLIDHNANVGELPWCENLGPYEAAIPSENCIFKHLDKGIVNHWMALASVAFVADVQPLCGKQAETLCAGSSEEDCFKICRFKLGEVIERIWGNPEEIDILASLDIEVVYENGEATIAYQLDGSYPAYIWTVSPGRNLIFANKACNYDKLTGSDTLYLIAGIYPVENELVCDLDNQTLSLSSLIRSVDGSGITVDEDALYRRMCDFESSLPDPSENDSANSESTDAVVIPTSI